MKSKFSIFVMITFLLPAFCMTPYVAAEEEEEDPVVEAGMEDWDALGYKINLFVDYPNDSIYGYVRITGRSLVNDLSHIHLHLAKLGSCAEHYLHADSVQVENDPYAWITRPQGLLYTKINFFSTEYDIDEVFDVSLYYHGTPRPFDHFFDSLLWHTGLIFDEVGESPITYNMSEHKYSRYWWPCKDVPYDKADLVELKIRYPDWGFTCAANGELINTTQYMNGTEESFWSHNHAIAPYQIGLGISDYVRLDYQYTSAVTDTPYMMPVQFFVFPSCLDTAQKYFPRVLDMIDAFEHLYGRYPYYDEKYGMMQNADTKGAMEYPTMTSISYKAYADTQLSHELSHAWWGNCVTCSTWNDIWINEGFARYSEALWQEWIDTLPGGGRTIFDYLDGYRWYDTGSVYVYTPTFPNVLNINLVFNKGAWVLHMLRHWVGDETFYAILSEHINRHKWGNALIQDFATVCMDVSEDDGLGDFFLEWIYFGYHPAYEYSYYVDDATNTEVHVILTQTQEPFEYYNMVPLVYHIYVDFIVYAGEESETFTLFNEEREQEFVLETSLTPPIDSLRMSLDWILAETTYVCRFYHPELIDGYVSKSYLDTVVFSCEEYFGLSLEGGELPPGLNLDGITGIISGTPTSSGLYEFTVKASLTTQGPYVYQDYSITISECDCRPGDANGDGQVNIGDAVYIQAFVFQSGPPPTPYEICSGDANCDCQVNVGDQVYIISYVFKGGLPPCSCIEWLDSCGPPLRE